MLAIDHTSPYILLDPVQGWQIASQQGLRTATDGALTLQPLPGEAIAVVDAATLALAGMQCPAGLATDGCGTVLIVDAAGGGVYTIDLNILAGNNPDTKCQAIRRIGGIGGQGSAAREFNAPRGIAARLGGGMVIADTGNGRVQSFAGRPHALTQVWQDLSALRDAQPTGGATTLKFPWSVALDTCGNLLVVDRGHRVVPRIDPHGRTLDNIGAGALADPTRLAVSARGIIAVADPKRRSVLLFRPGETSAFAEARPGGQAPLSVAFDEEGTLYVGDDIGLVHVFIPNGAPPQDYASAGSGDSRVTGRVIDLVWGGD